MTRPLTVLAFGIAVVIATAACSRPATRPTTSVTPLLGTSHLTTSRAELERTIATMREKVAKAPNDVPAAVTLADALLRQTRVSGNAGLAREAERALLDVLTRDRDRYDARRMLAAT
jgi:cytochrome c-type biogenesis protein CcmH/NrfG